ncbi:hypothetical protein JL722_4003 [Aureococcus anophagefferens]|nr:hypothetical protein JL722_4003 [Aureococcus anophagefferens]
MDASNYDPMAALDMEKRTGIKHADIDDFLERAKAVEQKIEDIRSGKISVEQLAAEQEAELRAKRDAEAAKIKRLAEIAEREKLRRAKEKAEERELPSDAIERDDADESAKDARLRKYENDYGRWSEGRWTPKDPATLEEEAAVEKEKTDKENAVFEKNNKEFCDNFMADMEVREKSKQKKDDTATAAEGQPLLQGEEIRRRAQALPRVLGVRPYEKTTLLNVAQVFLKMALWDDALEFAKRAVVARRDAAAEARAVDEAAALAEAAAGAPQLSDAEKTKRDSEELLAAFSKIAAKTEGGGDAVLDHALKMMEETGRGESLRAVDDVLERDIASLGDDRAADVRRRPRRLAAAPAPPATGAAKALVLSTLAAAVRGEPKSKDLAVDGGALEEILTVFADDGGHFNTTPPRASACELVAELAAADGAPRCPRSAAAHALKCLRDLADDEAARATLLRVGDEGDVAVVEAVAVAAKAAVSVKAADRAAAARAAAKTHAKNPMAAMGDPAAMCEAIAGELADYGCACLAHLAFSEQFRPASPAVAGRDARATPAGILLAAARDAGEAPEAAEAAGGVAVAYAFVRAPPRRATTSARARGPRAPRDGRGPRGLGRGRSAARARSGARRRRRGALGRGDAPAAEERDALVRAMAGALAADKDPDGAVRNFHAKGGYRVLAAILPRPGPTSAPAVAADLAAHGGIEKLVCCLANYKEMPVRRNCAVCLAKLMAIDKDLAPRVRELRGVEMITTLGNALIA